MRERARKEAREGQQQQLRLVSSRLEAEWSWFCGHCGAPPDGAAVPLPARVCERCRWGVVLEGRSAAVPQPGEAFVIVDADLVLHAVSGGAERLLGVYEIDAVARSLTDFMTPREVERGVIARTIVAAAVRDDRVRRATIRLRGSGGEPVAVRIGPCGAPRAAVVVFEGVTEGRPRLMLVPTSS